MTWEQTPEQWRAWYLAQDRQVQLVAARQILDNSRRRWRCDAEAHDRWLREAREAGCIPEPPHATTLSAEPCG